MKTFRSPLLLLLLLVCILSASQCKKDKNPFSDNGLPPATQEGANIFACRVNGEPWIAQKHNSGTRGGYRKDTLGVNGGRFSNPANKWDGHFNISLTGISITQGKTFKLNDTFRQFAVYVSTNTPCFNNSGSYGTNINYALNGELALTKLDTINNIISGTFWFTVPTQYCDTLHVTDGRFDFKYYKPM